MGRTPLLVWHSKNELARSLPVDRAVPSARCLDDPIRQAVAAEAGETHQIDVLNIRTKAKMMHERPKCGCRHSVLKTIQFHASFLGWRGWSASAGRQ
jgi:hypothetical protein